MADNNQLGTLTDQMKGWQAGAGDADLKISEVGKRAYVDAINLLRASLTDVQAKLGTLKGLGDPGKYDSATLTRDGIQDDAKTLDQTISDYLSYLTAYEKTVSDAADRMMQSG